MNTIKYSLITLILMLINIYPIYADCTDEEINNLKKETDKIEIIYKHLGEVTKEDGSKAYNEFMVTAKNIPENVYIHLSPMTEENFFEENGEVRIKLTTGEWTYNLYSSVCEDNIDKIKVKLPIFNIYSLDPLCEGIDGNKFKLCGKYYESTISRDIFEKRVKEYRNTHFIEINNDSENDISLISKIINFIKKEKLYLLIGITLLLIIATIIKIIKVRNKRKEL